MFDKTAICCILIFRKTTQTLKGLVGHSVGCREIKRYRRDQKLAAITRCYLEISRCHLEVARAITRLILALSLYIAFCHHSREGRDRQTNGIMYVSPLLSDRSLRHRSLSLQRKREPDRWNHVCTSSAFLCIPKAHASTRLWTLARVLLLLWLLRVRV